MPGILIDCLRKYQRLSQTPLESTRAPVHFLMLGGAGQAVPTIDAYVFRMALLYFLFFSALPCLDYKAVHGDKGHLGI